jgi:hypothetical protein
LQFVPRSAAHLHEFLQQLAAEGRDGTLPSSILSRLLTTSGALWRLLLGAAESDPELSAPVRALLARVLSEGALRMRGTARHLPRELLQLPYFSSSGRLTRDIDTLVQERFAFFCFSFTVLFVFYPDKHATVHCGPFFMEIVNQFII